MLREQQLFSKFNKCDFFKYIIQYLGHVVSKDGISVDPDKIKAVTEWHVPKNIIDKDHLWGLLATTVNSLKHFLR